MSQFCASGQSLAGGIYVGNFVFSQTASSKRLDNRLPVGLLSNALRVCELVVAAEKLLNASFNLLSGYRCPALNSAVYGSPQSLHMQALAVDGIFRGVGMLDACRRLAASDLPICEIEAKQTQLHFAYGDPRKRKLLRQYEARGPLVVVQSFDD